MPLNTAPRPALHDLKGRTPSEIFQRLASPTDHVAAIMINRYFHFKSQLLVQRTVNENLAISMRDYRACQ